jgi:hypothetical protein
VGGLLKKQQPFFVKSFLSSDSCVTPKFSRQENTLSIPPDLKILASLALICLNSNFKGLLLLFYAGKPMANG